VTHAPFINIVFILKVSGGRSLFLPLVQCVWRFTFGDILGEMKASFDHQREQLVSMNSIEIELSRHFEKVYADG
jgi:hypothetical protein